MTFYKNQSFLFRLLIGNIIALIIALATNHSTIGKVMEEKTSQLIHIGIKNTSINAEKAPAIAIINLDVNAWKATGKFTPTDYDLIANLLDELRLIVKGPIILPPEFSLPRHDPNGKSALKKSINTFGVSGKILILSPLVESSQDSREVKGRFSWHIWKPKWQNDLVNSYKSLFWASQIHSGYSRGTQTIYRSPFLAIDCQASPPLVVAAVPYLIQVYCQNTYDKSKRYAFYQRGLDETIKFVKDLNDNANILCSGSKIERLRYPKNKIKYRVLNSKNRIYETITLFTATSGSEHTRIIPEGRARGSGLPLIFSIDLSSLINKSDDRVRIPENIANVLENRIILIGGDGRAFDKKFQTPIGDMRSTLLLANQILSVFEVGQISKISLPLEILIIVFFTTVFIIVDFTLPKIPALLLSGIGGGIMIVYVGFYLARTGVWANFAIPSLSVAGLLFIYESFEIDRLKKSRFGTQLKKHYFMLRGKR